MGVPSIMVSVGASGAIWGVLGAAAALAWRPANASPEMIVKPLRRNAVINLGLGLAISFVPQVDLWAHLGGGVAGAALVFSGVLTRGLHHPAARAEAESDSEATRSRSFSVAAGLVAGAMVASLLTAWVVGKPWQLVGPLTWTRHSLPLGVEFETPELLGEPKLVNVEGQTIWAVGEVRRDSIQIFVDRVELTESQREANLKYYRNEGQVLAETVDGQAWPTFGGEYRSADGLISSYWVQVRDDEELQVLSKRLPESPGEWRGVLQRIYGSLEAE